MLRPLSVWSLDVAYLCSWVYIDTGYVCMPKILFLFFNHRIIFLCLSFLMHVLVCVCCQQVNMMYRGYPVSYENSCDFFSVGNNVA